MAVVMVLGGVVIGGPAVSAAPDSPVAVLVVGSVPAASQDVVVSELLVGLGFVVVLVDDDSPDLAAMVAGYSPNVVGVSSSVVPTVVGASLRDLPVPLVTWEGYLFDEFGLTAGGGGNQGENVRVAGCGE
ncbi:MAG: hypothetical protein R2705_07495 [Ilumatobacteraceae bacterium]